MVYTLLAWEPDPDKVNHSYNNLKNGGLKAILGKNRLKNHELDRKKLFFKYIYNK